MKFNPSERTRILLAARMCEAVYLSFYEAPFLAWKSLVGGTVKPWTEGNAEGMGVIIDNTLFIVFRGTEKNKLKDWMTDFDAEPFPFHSFAKDATVHWGFYKYADHLNHHMMNFIRSNPGKRIIICGHSLGGSAAYLLAAQLWLTGIRPHVITFGAAPVGNREFVNAYNEALQTVTLRFENAGDIVPRLPSLAPWLRHVAARYYIPFFGKSIQRNPKKISRWSDIVGRRLVAIASFRPGSGTKDHETARYTKRLTKIFSK